MKVIDRARMLGAMRESASDWEGNRGQGFFSILAKLCVMYRFVKISQVWEGARGCH